MKANAYQKKLDKQLLLWYNTRTRYVKEPSMTELTIGSFSNNPEKTAEIRAKIETIGSALQIVHQKKMPDVRTPVVAGGSVRDMVFGLHPRDFDIFFDLSGFPEDEMEDVVLLTGTYFLEELRKLPGYQFIDHTNLKRCGTAYSQGERAWKQGSFIVYETTGWDNEINWDVPTREMFRSSSFQFIGHVDKRLTEDPVSFLDAFDWPLTKCLYDPEDGNLVLTEDFMKVMASKQVTVTDDATYARVRGWLDRFDYMGYAHPFKVIDNRPARPKSPLYSTANPPLHNMVWEWNPEQNRIGVVPVMPAALPDFDEGAQPDEEINPNRI